MKIHQQWHHICLSLKTEDINSDEVSVTTKLYFDGSEATKGKEIDTIVYIGQVWNTILHYCMIYEPIMSWKHTFFRC